MSPWHACFWTLEKRLQCPYKSRHPQPPPHCDHNRENRTRGKRKCAGIATNAARVRHEASRELLAPREDVWGFLAEPYHLSDWWPTISGVRPDRRGLAPGARWEIVGAPQPTLLHRPRAQGLLIVREVDPLERVVWQFVD